MPVPPIVMDGLSANLKGSLEEKLSGLKDRVATRAHELASQRSTVGEHEPVQIDMADLSGAFDELVRGHLPAPSPPPRIRDFFPPFTWLCGGLCIAFATLGLIASMNSTAAKIGSAAAAGFLDIAKIFAGAIVGSTTSIALGSVRAKSGREQRPGR